MDLSNHGTSWPEWEHTLPQMQLIVKFPDLVMSTQSLMKPVYTYTQNVTMQVHQPKSVVTNHSLILIML